MPLGYIDVAPDLAIEVRSSSDRWPAIHRKVTEYLDAGVQVVCVFDDQSKTVHVDHAQSGPRIVASDGELDLSEVMPGFRMRVQRFFE